MRCEFNYLRAQSLAEALGLLTEYHRDAAVAAGMTDLMIAIKEGQMKAPYLIDINRLDELSRIEDKGGAIEIGPLVSHARLASSELIRRELPVLAQASGSVGSPQIRNIGTLGGNIGNASPAADTLPALTVLNARVTLGSQAGLRSLPLTDFILRPYQTAARPEEMIVGLSVPRLGGEWQGLFYKLARRKALAPSRLSLAVQVLRPADKVEAVRLSIGATTPRPCRLREAEDFLTGRQATPANLAQTARLAAEEILRRTGLRYSSQYKQPAIEGLVQKALGELVERGPRK